MGTIPIGLPQKPERIRSGFFMVIFKYTTTFLTLETA